MVIGKSQINKVTINLNLIIIFLLQIQSSRFILLPNEFMEKLKKIFNYLLTVAN